VTKTLADLQALCDRLGIIVPPGRRPAKEPYLHALRGHFWAQEYPGLPLPEQIEPMLLGDWDDLDEPEAAALERDESGWCVQEKHDGVRCLLHATPAGVRLTGRTVSDVTFRLAEFQANVPHLTTGFDGLTGTVLDGELVCPVAALDTGDTITTHPLQAAVAILATGPDNAQAIQERHACPLRFVVFDVLRDRGTDVTGRPLRDRLKVLEEAFLSDANPHLDLAETHVEEKGLFHELILSEGKEGTVWKRLDGRYEPGRRVRHWLKRKRRVEVEAVVSGFKPGSAGRGNAHLIGAVEFSVVNPDGTTRPVAWVSNWSDEERRGMTVTGADGPALNPEYLGRKALIVGHDVSGRSGRYRHARITRWVA
jgi:ATP-dependent DNA ligase